MGFLPDLRHWQGAGEPATSQMRCSSRTGGFFPPRRGFTALGWRIAPAFFTLPARWRNVGFSCRAAHALAVGAEIRAQRRHAAHGGERCPLWKGARMQTVQGVTPLPSCSGKRQSHWSARRSERMPRFRFAIFSVRSEMPSFQRSPSTESHAPDEVQMQWLRPPVQGCSCPAQQCGAYPRFSAARRSKRFWLMRGSR